MSVDYWQVDNRRIYDLLQQNLTDLEAFRAQVADSGFRLQSDPRTDIEPQRHKEHQANKDCGRPHPSSWGVPASGLGSDNHLD